MESTWSRDFAVLEAIVRLYDSEGSAVSVQELEADTGLDGQDVQKAIRALLGEDPPFITVGPVRGGGYYSLVGGVTGHARRTVGAWPTAESLTTRLADAFAEAAEDESEPERRGFLRRGAEFFGGVGKDVTSEVIAKVITQRM